MLNKKHFSNLKWAVFTMVDRSTQDDNRSKVNVSGLFVNPTVAEYYLIPNLPNQEIKRYVLHASLIDRFEEFYNFIQDLNKKYGEKAIYHLDEGNFTSDEETLFRNMLNLWTSTDLNTGRR
ncbi:MAG: hypothetical protein ACLRVD_08285 [Blautia caecimuris]